LKENYKKLENVITKDDTFLKNLAKDVKLKMRSEFFINGEKARKYGNPNVYIREGKCPVENHK
jgi:hypothetical protein